MATNNTVVSIGDRLRIHPASDWFMRGVVYCRVIGTSRKAHCIRVEMEGFCTRFGNTYKRTMHLANLMDLDGNSLTWVKE